MLFLDEPTTGLDPVSRHSLWREVRRLREQGTTILLSTQYLEEADVLADRVGILAAGRLRVEGPPEQLKRDLDGDLLTVEVDPADTPAAAALDAGSPRPGHLTRHLDDGGAALPRLLGELDRHGIAVHSVALTRPSLDDVFLKVVGQHLTVDADPATRYSAAA